MRFPVAAREIRRPQAPGSVSRSTALDFFAGSGLVTEGLKDRFDTVWANDICPKKAAVFRANHPDCPLHVCSIEEIRGRDLPDACLSWASFPCQDLSLAGNMHGIDSARSGLVWQWLRVMDEMPQRPALLVAENVVGLLSTNAGANYQALHHALTERGYRVGPVVIDAVHWVPQSRKRVFVVAVRNGLPTAHVETRTYGWCHPEMLRRAVNGLDRVVWWRIPAPDGGHVGLDQIVDKHAPCHSDDQTERLLSLLPPHHRRELEKATRRGLSVFPAYKRVRGGQQVLELRFDNTAGCLRTPQGGSSRQFLLIYEDGHFRSRLLTVAETAALMGAPPDYGIPGSYNDGYRAMGDAVAVPVVRFLAESLLHPLATSAVGDTNES